MTTAVMAKRSQYPIERAPEIDAMVDAVVAFRSSEGVYTLRRELTSTERRAIIGRRNLVVDNLQAARAGDIYDDVLAMLVGFGSARQGEDDAKEVATQYVTMLGGMPAWAIRRACLRWGSGQVTADEIGERMINRAFAPSPAQVRVVAEKIARPFVQEVARINKTLSATTDKTITPEQREESRPRIQAKLEEFHQIMAARALADIQPAAPPPPGAPPRLSPQERTEQECLAEYRRRELTPVYLGGKLVSIPLLISLGWRIENNGWRDILIQPGIEPTRHQPADYQGEGS